MPLYVYACPSGHLTERLAPREREVISCQCGLTSSRREVNPIGVSGFAVTPRNEKNYRQSFNEYREASAEVNHAYDREGFTAPDLYGAAKARLKDA